jgi:hypothetical protein
MFPLGTRMRNTLRMQHAFGTVLFVVAGVGVLAALASLLSSGKMWEEYGKRGLVMDRDDTRAPARGSAAEMLERDTEIRQMLEARNARRLRRGEPTIDVEAELARLTTPQIDAELRGEIRDLVIARNHRRARAGKPPLDIEAEIEREIAGLSGL